MIGIWTMEGGWSPRKWIPARTAPRNPYPQWHKISRQLYPLWHWSRQKWHPNRLNVCILPSMGVPPRVTPYKWDTVEYCTLCLLQDFIIDLSSYTNLYLAKSIFHLISPEHAVGQLLFWCRLSVQEKKTIKNRPKQRISFANSIVPYKCVS